MTPPSATAASEQEFPAGPPPAPRDVTFLQDPIVDHLLRAVVTLTMELSATRERLHSLELVLGGQEGNVSRDIESLSFTPEQDALRRAERERLVEQILAPLVNTLSNAA